jgi:hypothetical protein
MYPIVLVSFIKKTFFSSFELLCKGQLSITFGVCVRVCVCALCVVLGWSQGLHTPSTPSATELHLSLSITVFNLDWMFPRQVLPIPDLFSLENLGDTQSWGTSEWVLVYPLFLCLMHCMPFSTLMGHLLNFPTNSSSTALCICDGRGEGSCIHHLCCLLSV